MLGPPVFCATIFCLFFFISFAKTEHGLVQLFMFSLDLWVGSPWRLDKHERKVCTQRPHGRSGSCFLQVIRGPWVMTYVSHHCFISEKRELCKSRHIVHWADGHLFRSSRRMGISAPVRRDVRILLLYNCCFLGFFFSVCCHVTSVPHGHGRISPSECGRSSLFRPSGLRRTPGEPHHCQLARVCSRV